MEITFPKSDTLVFTYASRETITSITMTIMANSVISYKDIETTIIPPTSSIKKKKNTN
jgi:hypothetical protein